MVSILIPTLNSGRTLDECLSAIRMQDFPRDQMEIVVADAGSTDETLAIARRHGVDRIVPNPLRTGEAGKAAAIRASRGDLLALIDSDNVLPDPQWLRRMTAPFADPSIQGAEPISYTCRPSDPALTRYFALLGMNDPLCLFLGNYDRTCGITGRWTGLPVRQEDRGDFLLLTLEEPLLPTIGANGFVFRRSLLDRVSWTPYFFDIDVVHQAVASGCPRFAKVKTGIVHLYCGTLSLFARKQQRRIRDFLHFSTTRQRTYPWRRQNRAAIFRFALCTALALPLLVQQARGMRRQPDPAWWYHVPVCWITLWVYGLATLGRMLGRTPPAMDRGNWQQPAKKSRRRRALRPLLKFLMGAGLLLLLFRRQNIRWPDLAETVTHLSAQPLWLAATLLLVAACLLCGALRWWTALAGLGVRLSRRRAAALFLVGHFFNGFLPGSTGGDVARAFYMAREMRGQRPEAILSIVVERLAGVAILLLLTLGGLLVVTKPGALPLAESLPVVCGIAVLALVTGLALFRRYSGGGLPGWIGRHTRFGSLAHRLFDAWRLCQAQPALLLRLLGWSLLQHLFAVASWLTLAWGLGLGASVQTVPFLLLVPAVLTAQMLPLTPGGLGVREGAAAALLPAAGIAPHMAMLTALASYGASLAWSAVGGAVFVLLKEPRPAR